MPTPRTTPPRIAVVGGGICRPGRGPPAHRAGPTCELVAVRGPARGWAACSGPSTSRATRSSRAPTTSSPPCPGRSTCAGAWGWATSSSRPNPAFAGHVRRAQGRLCPLPDGFMMMAPTRFWPLATDADPQPAGQAPRGRGVLHPAAHGRRRREHGRLRPPPAGRRGLRPAGRAAGQRRLRGRPGEAQRPGHACLGSARWSASTAA